MCAGISFDEILPAPGGRGAYISAESKCKVGSPWSSYSPCRPSNEHPGLISFRMDWLDILAVQGTLKSLLQQHNSKASILWRSVFFMVLHNIIVMKNI